MVVTAAHNGTDNTYMHCADACILREDTHSPPRPHGTERAAVPSLSTQAYMRRMHGHVSSGVVDVATLFTHGDISTGGSAPIATVSQNKSSVSPCPVRVESAHATPSSSQLAPFTDHKDEKSCTQVSGGYRGGSQAPMTDTDSDSVLDQKFVALGHHIEHCSSRLFNELRQKMKVEREFFQSCAAELPTELLDGNGAGLKTMMNKGFLGQKGWSVRGKVAVARLLLAYDRDVLLAQLGALSQVCGPSIYWSNPPTSYSVATHLN